MAKVIVRDGIVSLEGLSSEQNETYNSWVVASKEKNPTSINA